MPINSDRDIARVLDETRTIALIGASEKRERPSHRVMRFLLEQGIAHQEEARLASGFLGQFPQAQTVLESAASGDPLAARHQG